MKILLVEDEKTLSSIISKGLKKLSYAVDSAFNGQEALDLFNVNADKRQARLDDIYNERIKEMEETTTSMTRELMERNRKQEKEFKSLVSQYVELSRQEDNLALLKKQIEIANFLKVELPYSDLEEFKKMRQEEKLKWRL